MHRGEVAAARHDAEEPDYAVDIGFRPIPADPPIELVQRRVGLRHLPMRRTRALLDRETAVRLEDRDDEIIVVSHRRPLRRVPFAPR